MLLWIHELFEILVNDGVCLCSFWCECMCLNLLHYLICFPAAEFQDIFFRDLQHGHDGSVEVAKIIERYVGNAGFGNNAGKVFIDRIRRIEDNDVAIHLIYQLFYVWGNPMHTIPCGHFALWFAIILIARINHDFPVEEIIPSERF